MTIEKHFCVTNYVIDEKTGDFLLIYHKKLNKWLPPGGHIEINETPEEAALRETYEETGLNVSLVGKPLPRPEDIINPFAIQLNRINEHHFHMDLIYLSTASSTMSLLLNENEATKINWFSINKILENNFNTFDTTKEWCKKFYNLYH